LPRYSFSWWGKANPVNVIADTVQAQYASPSPSAEIAGLDPEHDYERIVFLLSYQLFQWDVERALEFALLNTYAIPSISGLLARTGEFTRRARKRYDDTELLLAEIGENGFDSDRASQALDRVNAMHGRFRIANDDYLYVLSTFVFSPIDWMAAYGRRAFTAKEQLAWLHYYQELGRRMGIADIPATSDAFRAFREKFEAERMVFAGSNREVAAVTVDLVLGMYVPRLLYPIGRPVAMALCSERLVAAIGARQPPRWLRRIVRATMRLRGRFLGILPEPKQLRRITRRSNPTYPNGYEIAGLGVLRPGRS
jgi:ER-bound oxygenase mpaB/B'/Rubber oxygenase, catalytic domain